MQGEQSNHTYEECRQKLCNQAELKSHANYYNNKRAYDTHHQDSCAHSNRYLSSNNESRRDNCTPMLSNGKASASIGSKVANKNYHLSLDGKCPKKQRVTFAPRQSHRSDTAKLPKELKGSDIEWDDAFDDRYLTNFEMGVEDADLKNGINPFAFGN